MPIKHCEETRKRVRLTVAAWAYEKHNDPIMSDAEYDQLALSIDLRKTTSRPDLDDWWRENFNPSTGMWVFRHPEVDIVEKAYRLLRPRAPVMSVWQSFLWKALNRSLHS